jgi:hypothetical protein
MDSEIRQIHRIFTQSSYCWLMHIFLTAKYVMDCLINLMNNKHFSPSLSNFPLITTPWHIPYSLCSPPFLMLITAKRIFVLSGWSGSVLSGLQWGFIWLIYSWLLLSLSSDHFFSPFIISFFSPNTNPSRFLEHYFTLCSLINVRKNCMDWIAWAWYILIQIYFVFLRSFHAWLFKKTIC